MIRLPEEDKEAFHVHAHWAYTGALDLNSMPEPVLLAHETPSPPALLNLTKVWILSNFLSNGTLCNQVIDRILQKLDGEPGTTVAARTLQYIFQFTAEDSKLRALYVEAMLARPNEKHFEKWGHEYPQDLLFQFARNMLLISNQHCPDQPSRIVVTITGMTKERPRS